MAHPVDAAATQHAAAAAAAASAAAAAPPAANAAPAAATEAELLAAFDAKMQRMGVAVGPRAQLKKMAKNVLEASAATTQQRLLYYSRANLPFLLADAIQDDDLISQAEAAWTSTVLAGLQRRCGQEHARTLWRELLARLPPTAVGECCAGWLHWQADVLQRCCYAWGQQLHVRQHLPSSWLEL